MNFSATTKRLDYGVMPLRVENGRVLLLDQRHLPDRVEFFNATGLEDMCFAIREMVVRGAPSIGVAAAFGLSCEAKTLAQKYTSTSDFLSALSEAKSKLQATRPTAVNLKWATEKVFDLANKRAIESDPAQIAEDLFKYAEELLQNHIEINRKLSEYGVDLVKDNSNIITHCNAGPLATCGWGTALGVIRSAHVNGLKPNVFVGETRPRNQGAKLTMWELAQDKIPATLICDSMAGYVMSNKKIDMIIVGADRIALNGDTANKIGTYNLAVLANFHKVPFYIAAPLSTIDPSIESGNQIPIEERNPEEVTTLEGKSLTTKGAKALNPAFDVTSADLISGIITEAGILTAPYKQSIQAALKTSDHG
jgi:methylthioribose-1-phosphate isomerase